jgi:hypothetical protein
VNHRTLGSAPVADAAGKPTGVDARYSHEVVRFEPGIQVPGRPPIGGIGDRQAQHTAAGRRCDGFDVIRVDTDVANVREGKSDYLAGIGGIGQDLLVTGKRGIETHLTDSDSACTGTQSPIYRAIFQHQCCICTRRATRGTGHPRGLHGEAQFSRLGH